MAQSPKGIDVRQTSGALVFRAFMQTAAGAKETTGPVNLSLYELQSDGSFKSYDFSTNTFVTTALTTATEAMTHQKGNNATVNTGVWTYALATLTGFTAGGIYIAQVNDAAASPTDQTREFQFGSVQGDLTVDTHANLNVNAHDAAGTAITAGAIPAVAAGAAGGLPTVDTNNNIHGVQPGTGTGQLNPSGGKVPATIASGDYTGNTVQTGDSFARLGVPAGVSIAADIAEIEAETDGIAAIPTSNPSAATIAGAVWDALTIAHTVTGSFGLLIATDLDTNVGSRLATSGYTTPPTAAQNATAVWTDATAGDFTTAGTPGKILVGQLGGAFTSNTSSVFTVGALANGPSGSGSTPAAIASAVWQDLTSSSDFTTVGSIGKLLAAIKLDGSGNAYSVDQFGNQLASLNQVSNVVGTGAAFNVFATSETLSIGTDTGGLANTFVSGGSEDTWTAVGGFIQGTYIFDLSSMPGAVPVAVYWLGYYVGAGNATVAALNWGTSVYDQIGSIANVAGSSQQASAVFSLTNAYVGTGANAGKVQVRFAAGPSATSFNTDRILLGCDVTPPANWNALGITSGGHISVVDTLTNLPGTAATAASQASILTAVGTPMQAGTAVDVESINSNATAAANLAALYGSAVVPGTVGTVASGSDFQLSGASLSSSDGDYNSMWLIFTSGANKTEPRIIGTYTGATKRVQFTGSGVKGAFNHAPSVGDSFVIMAASQ